MIRAVIKNKSLKPGDTENKTEISRPPLLPFFTAMVSEDSPSNTNSNIMHHFLIPNSMANQRQFADHHFGDGYGVDSVSNGGRPYTHSLPSAIFADRIARSVKELEISHDRLMDLLGVSNDAAAPARMLSLSLGSASCRQKNLNSAALLNHVYRESCNPQLDRRINEYSFAGNAFVAPSSSSSSVSQCCSTSYGTESFTAANGNSKYLKPAQSLLEEMLCVGGRDVDESNRKYVEKLSGSLAGRRVIRLSSERKAEFPNLPNEQGTYVNLIKLLTLLEEVERRYEEYHRHFDGVVSSFEVIAGLGAGKSYTTLALQAMSKHFSSLRKAIMVQVRAAKQREEKDMPKISARLSQLNLYNKNRVPLQQLGIMQNSRQAYGPIGGLRENSVTILRAWLSEHFLHPYPLDSEKLMLASQTGLSKNQMIEEMNKDEFRELSSKSDQLLASSCIREGAGDSAQDLN